MNHFLWGISGNPVMPGVLQIEALAQTGGILAINALPPESMIRILLKWTMRGSGTKLYREIL